MLTLNYLPYPKMIFELNDDTVFTKMVQQWPLQRETCCDCVKETAFLTSIIWDKLEDWGISKRIEL